MDCRSYNYTTNENCVFSVYNYSNTSYLLDTFKNTSPFGDWILLLNDTQEQYGGYLYEWCVEVCYENVVNDYIFHKFVINPQMIGNGIYTNHHKIINDSKHEASNHIIVVSSQNGTCINPTINVNIAATDFDNEDEYLNISIGSSLKGMPTIF